MLTIKINNCYKTQIKIQILEFKNSKIRICVFQYICINTKDERSRQCNS